MNKVGQAIMAFMYGALAYACFVGTFLYMIGFTGNLVVPKSIDGEQTSGTLVAILINAGLLGLFAVQHAIMARPWFKSRWTRIVPQSVERSTFVLATCAVLGLLVWQWRPMEAVIWQIESGWARWAMMAMSAAGWGLVLYSSFLIDHFDLFGLRQVWMPLRAALRGGAGYEAPRFVERSVYKLVRHPLMLGFLMAFWFTPVMTAGHLLFAVMVTGYILVGTRMEERDLLRTHGLAYADYRRRTAMLLPIPRRLPSASGAPAVEMVEHASVR